MVKGGRHHLANHGRTASGALQRRERLPQQGALLGQRVRVQPQCTQVGVRGQLPGLTACKVCVRLLAGLTTVRAVDEGLSVSEKHRWSCLSIFIPWKTQFPLLDERHTFRILQ